MGAFEARLKANARLRWLVPLAVVTIVVLTVAGWMLLSGGVDPAAQRRHAEAMALVALDDITSLERASQALDELSRERSRIASVDADHALAQLLLATGLAEDVAPQAERLARKVVERDRAAASQPQPQAQPQPQPQPQPATPEALKVLTAEVEALRGQVEPRQAKARSLSDQAYAALKKLSGEREGDLSVARALAIHFASSGDREQALRFIRASGAGDRDPWIRLAEGWLDAREEGKEPRERAVGKLTALVAAQPEIVRARFLLARTQAALGRREEAAATLDRLLAANPGHNRARRLREELVLPPSPAQLQPAAMAPRLLPPPAPMPAAGTPPPGLPPGQAAVPTAPQGVAPRPAAPAPARPAPVVAPGTAPVAPAGGAVAIPRPAAAPPVQPKPTAAPATAAPVPAAKPALQPASATPVPIPGAKPALQPAPATGPAPAPAPAPARPPASTPRVSDTDAP
jgi:tetratricopeptide (TPR) repeat protein